MRKVWGKGFFRKGHGQVLKNTMSATYSIMSWKSQISRP
jgi:hypothetical protein